MGEKNLTKSSVQKLIKDFTFEPAFHRVVITLNRITNDKGVITSEEGLDEVQYVLAASGGVFEPGDRVLLDLEKMTVKERSKADVTQIIERIKVTPFKYGKYTFAIIGDHMLMGKYTK